MTAANSPINHTPSILVALWLLLLGIGAAKCAGSDMPAAACRIQSVLSFGGCSQSGCTPTESAYGSGTLIDVAAGGDAGLVITCAHVVEGAKQIIVVFPDGITHGANVVAIDTQADLAALSIRRPPGAAVEFSPLADSAPAQITGDRYTIAGFGGEGRYRAVDGEFVKLNQGTPGQVNLEVRCSARQGDSGGGVFDHQGRLVAVLWGTEGGVTYCSTGGPLRRFVDRCLPGRRGAAGDAVGSGAAVAGGANGCTCDAKWAALDGKLTAIDQRLAAIGEAGYVKQAELPAAPALDDFAKRSELDELARQKDLEAVAAATAEGNKTLRAQMKDIVGAAGAAAGAKVKAGLAGVVKSKVGFLETGLGKFVAVSLGIGGPLGWAVAAGVSIAARRLKKRIAAAPGGRRGETFHHTY